MQTVYHFRFPGDDTTRFLDGFIRWKYNREEHDKFVTERQVEIAEIFVFDSKKNDQFFNGKGKDLHIQPNCK